MRPLDVMIVIYKLTNKITGLSYIGQTKNFRHRMREHKKKYDKYRLHRAIQHYGWENFDVEIIDVYSKRENADMAETRYIKEYNTLSPNGYNLTTGGETRKALSQESREKMSKSQKERAKRPEDLQRRTEITKKRFQDPVERERMLKHLSTGKDTPEYRAKISQSQKQRCKNPEERERRSMASKKWAEEHSKEISERMKKYYDSHPEARERVSKRMKEYSQKVRNGIIKGKDYPNNCAVWVENNIGHLRVPYKDTFFIFLFDEDRIKDIEGKRWLINISKKENMKVTARVENKVLSKVLYPNMKQVKHLNGNSLDNRAVNLKEITSAKTYLA